MSHSFRRSVHVTVAVTALLIVLVSAIVRFIVGQRMEHSVEQAMQAAEVQTQLGATFSLLQGAETAQRGFLLTGQAPFLEPFNRAEQALPEQLDQLESMLNIQSGAALYREIARIRACAAHLRQYAASFAADDLEKHVATFPQLIALLEERTARTFAHVSA